MTLSCSDIKQSDARFSIVLDNKVLLTEYDIESYDWDTHSIRYSDEAAERIFSNKPNTKAAIMPMNF